MPVVSTKVLVGTPDFYSENGHNGIAAGWVQVRGEDSPGARCDFVSRAETWSFLHL